MKRMVALLSGFSAVVAASAAYAQSVDDSQVNPPQQEPQQEAQPQPPPVSGDGQWVYIDGEGYVWVPAESTPYVVQDVPYVYLYTPSVGWGWVVSPWGFGRYYYGGWAHHPWWTGHGWGYWPRYGGAPHGTYGAPHGAYGTPHGAYGPHYGPHVYGPGVQHGGYTHPGGFAHPGGGFHHGGGRH